MTNDEKTITWSMGLEPHEEKSRDKPSQTVKEGV
jgi:hypothetical protein